MVFDRGNRILYSQRGVKENTLSANNEIDLIIQNQIYDKDYTNMSDETEEAQSTQPRRVVELISPLKAQKDGLLQ